MSWTIAQVLAGCAAYAQAMYPYRDRDRAARADGQSGGRSPANSSCCGNRASPDPAPPRLRLNTLCDRRRRALIQQGGPHRSRPFGKNSDRAWAAGAPDGWRSRNCALSTIGRCRTSGSPAAISNTLRGMEIVANDAVAVAGLGPATSSGDGVCVRAGDAGHRARTLAAALDLRGVTAAVAGGRRGRASRGFRRVRRQASADQEPITPIPPPPAADPLKLKLGERLFGDPRLSGDGKLSCSSCHDLRTNGASAGRKDHCP